MFFDYQRRTKQSPIAYPTSQIFYETTPVLSRPKERTIMNHQNFLSTCKSDRVASTTSIQVVNKSQFGNKDRHINRVVVGEGKELHQSKKIYQEKNENMKQGEPNMVFDMQQITHLNAISNSRINGKKMEYLDNEATRLIDIEYQSNLKETVIHLEGKLLAISQERDQERKKLLEYQKQFIQLQNENKKIKKSIPKKEKQDIVELKKLLNEEIQAKQCLLKEKLSALTQLNDALNFYEQEKVKWEKEKTILQQKIEIINNDSKEKTKQNLLLVENLNKICQKNWELRGRAEQIEAQLDEKESQRCWMSTRVSELELVLETIKDNGNFRIQELENQMISIKANRNQNELDLKTAQNLIKEKSNEIEKLSIQINQKIQAQEKMSKKLMEFEETTKYIGQINKTMEEKMTQLLSQISQKELMIEELIGKIKILEKSCLDDQKRMKEVMDRMEEELRSKDELNGEMQKMLIQTKKQANQELQNIRKLLRDMTQKYDKQMRQKESTETLVREKDEEIAHLNEKILANQNNYWKISEEINNLQEQLKKLSASQQQHTQLQLKLYEILEVGFIKNNDQIMIKIENLVTSQKYWSKFWGSLMELYELRGSSDKLLQQIFKEKNSYNAIVKRCSYLEELGMRWKQEHQQQEERIQWGQCLIHKLEILLQFQNQANIKLGLQLCSDKYRNGGLKVKPN